MTLHPAPKHFILNEESPIKFQMALSSDKILEKKKRFFFLDLSILESTSTVLRKWLKEIE